MVRGPCGIRAHDDAAAAAGSYRNGSGGVVLGAVLVRMRVLVLCVVGVFGVAVLVVVVLGAFGAFVVALTVRVGVRVPVLGVVRILRVVMLVVGVLLGVLSHQGGSSS